MAAFPQLTDVKALGSWTINGANAVEYIPGRPTNVYGMVFVYTTAHDTAVATITVTRRPTAGSASGAETIGTFELPVAAAGVAKIVYFGEPAAATTGSDGSTVNAGWTEDGVELDVGESINFASDGGGGSGVGQAYVLEHAQAVTPPYGRSSDVAEITFTRA